ncbi:hypothetical protein M0R19_09185 [Candidatus Pacearchaeota archaeon]|jgi:hypothetical protein|nr:hypothetical protein [Candidatus Pacearchaeota archaeon]
MPNKIGKKLYVLYDSYNDSPYACFNTIKDAEFAKKFMDGEYIDIVLKNTDGMIDHHIWDIRITSLYNDTEEFINDIKSDWKK